MRVVSSRRVYGSQFNWPLGVLRLILRSLLRRMLFTLRSTLNLRIDLGSGLMGAHDPI